MFSRARRWIALNVAIIFTIHISMIYGYTEEPPTQQQVFEETKEWADLNKEQPYIAGQNYEKAYQNVPGFGTYPDEIASTYQNGMGVTSAEALGMNLITSCSQGSQTPECSAVTYVNENASKRQEVEIPPDDPLLTKSKSLRNDAYASAEGGGTPTGAVTEQYQDCETRTVEIGEVYTTETCQDYWIVHEYDCQQWIEAKVVDGKVVTELVSGECPLKGTCEVVEQTCIEGPETRIIDGVPVYQACWRWNIHYGCKEGEATSCDELYGRPECEMVSEECIDETLPDPLKPRPWDGQCDVVQRTFSCLTAEAYTKEYTDCRTVTVCTQHNANFESCYVTKTPRDQDFVKAMMATEIGRQAGAYVNQDSKTLYDMGDNRCTIDFGFKNCCKPNPGGENFTNSQTMGLGIALAGQAIKTGAKYVFDTLLAKSSMSLLGGGIGATMGLTPLNEAVAALNGALAPFGVSIGIGLPVSGSFVMVGNYMVTFNQIALLIMVAKFLYGYLMTCDPNSQLTDMLLGQNLCHYVGSYCSRRVIGICIQVTQTYCCSNGRLGLAINEQGRQQIGKGWGSPEAPFCLGFTPEEFASLNLEAMNLEQFEQEMQTNVQYPDPTAVREAIAGNISSGKFQNPYDPLQKKGVSSSVSQKNYYER